MVDKPKPKWSFRESYDGDIFNPPWSVKEVARLFGRSPEWVRQRERDGKFKYEDGSPILPERVGRRFARSYNLSEIRAMVESIGRTKSFKPNHYQRVLNRVEAYEK